jgi:hypothetical protein
MGLASASPRSWTFASANTKERGCFYKRQALGIASSIRKSERAR